MTTPSRDLQHGVEAEPDLQLRRPTAAGAAGSLVAALKRRAGRALGRDEGADALPPEAEPVTRFYLRMRLAAAFALILGVILFSHLAISAMRADVRTKTQVLEALTAAQSGMSAIELGLHDLVATRDVWRAEESRAGIRSGRAQLIDAAAAIERLRGGRALDRLTEDVLGHPMLRPLEKIALMTKLAEPLIERDGPLGRDARRFATLAVDVSRVTQPALQEMRRGEYAALLAATDKLAVQSVVLVTLCFGALAFSTAFIFLPLERRVIQSQAVILRKTEAAEMTSKFKSQFLAVMSHEIRTPMNGVLGMAEILSHTRLDGKQTQMLDIIKSSGKTLVSLLDDILDLSRLEANAAQFEARPFDMRAVVGDCASLFAPLAGSKGVALGHEVDPAVATLHVGDETRLRQVVANLVSNAIKFTEAGSVRLALGVIAEAEGAQTLALSVQDTGVGIPVDAQTRIFDVFEQADSSTTRRFGGTGLGLAIVKRLVEGMGGGVAVESAPGVGSTFTITLTLPVAAAPAAGPPPTPLMRPPAGAGERRALVVDDQEINQKVARAMLESLGFDVRVCDGGGAAVSAASRFDPELILMDVAMPQMDGLEATRRIRARSSAHGPRIIGMSANPGREQATACSEAGMDGFLGKPLDFDQLGAAIVAAPEPAASPRRAARESVGS